MNREVKIDIMIDCKGETFSFKLKSLCLNEEVRHFLLINLLVSMDFRPDWLSVFYQEELKKHKRSLN